MLVAATEVVRPVAAVEGNTAALVEVPLWVAVSVAKEEAQALVRLGYVRGMSSRRRAAPPTWRRAGGLPPPAWG